MARNGLSNRRLVCSVPGFILLCASWVSVVVAGATNAEFVAKLIETSSAAKQVESSGNAKALAKWQKARELLEVAGAAQSRGDADQAGKLLQLASRAMFEAVKLANTRERAAVKQSADFDSRLESVEALAMAYNRIGSDKSAANREEVRLTIAALVTKSKATKAGGDVEAARKVLDEAYLLAKSSIEDLRGGDTLVRTLNFVSKEEEFHYEIDRNDTHKMLITVLLKEKLESKALKSMVNPFLDKADELRRAAESEARAGRFEDAVSTLEESTKNYIRAIRGAGVYIPG